MMMSSSLSPSIICRSCGYLMISTCCAWLGRAYTMVTSTTAITFIFFYFPIDAQFKILSLQPEVKLCECSAPDAFREIIVSGGGIVKNYILYGHVSFEIENTRDC